MVQVHPSLLLPIVCFGAAFCCLWWYYGGLALAGRQAPTQLLTYSCFPHGTGEKIGTMKVKELMSQNKNKEITNYCYRENRLDLENLI